MKHQIFNKLKLVLIENKGKFTLYRSDTPLLGQKELSQLKAVDFIEENADYIAVYPECNIIVAKETLYSVNGQKIATCAGNDIKIISQKGIYTIMSDSAHAQNGCLIMWNTHKVLLRIEYQKFIADKFYFAAYADKKWYVYDWKGNLRNADYLIDDDDIIIKGHFLIKSGIGNHELYSLKHGILLRQKQNIIMCSKTDDFALCASLNHRLEIFYRGGWRYIDNVDFFKLLDDIKLFCIQRDKKYYLYSYPRLKPVMTDDFPCGLDFVSYDEQSHTLLLKSDSRTFIINKKTALCKN